MNRFAMLWMVAIMALGSALIAHLHLRSKTVDLGYRVSNARIIQGQLTEEKRKLMLESAALRSVQRLEKIGKMELKMHSPEPHEFINARKMRTLHSVAMKQGAP